MHYYEEQNNSKQTLLNLHVGYAKLFEIEIFQESLLDGTAIYPGNKKKSLEVSYIME